MSRAAPLLDALAAWAARTPDAVALQAPDAPALSYRALDRTLDRARGRLAAAGLAPGQRVAVVLPQGRSALVATLAVMGAGAAVPLDPALPATAIAQALESNRVRAVLAPPGSDAAQAAAGLGIGLFSPDPTPGDPLGALPLVGRLHPRDPEDPDQVLVLATSGTGAAPRRVALTQGQLAGAAAAIGEALDLTPGDRALAVMPLHHVHGLSVAFASLRAGASARVVPPLPGAALARALANDGVTWTSAAPAVYRILLDALGEAPGAMTGHALRFLRSASSPMPTAWSDELESRLGIPFLEAYGMTEAAPQIASNRLAPGGRRRGSVGRPAGATVRILPRADLALADGAVGEIAIRGPSVIPRYDSDPEADRLAFADGWLRTGDLGRLDEDGFLYVVGRTRELIDRGGEKVSPAALDAALLSHPWVRDAAAHGHPHPALGAVPAALVVPAPAAPADPARLAESLREHLAARLPAHWIPHPLEIVPTIPRTASGKLGRRAVAATRDSARRAWTGLEEVVAGLWTEVLGRPPTGPDQDFVGAGGHSLAALDLAARLRDRLGLEVPADLVLRHPTVAGLAARLARSGPAAPRPEPDPPLAPGPVPLSPTQEAIWFLEALVPGRVDYHVTRALALAGPLDLPALGRALDALAERHEALRLVFDAPDGRPRQRVAAPAPVPLPVIDLAGLAGDAGATEAERRLCLEAAAPFALERGPPFRATLIRRGAEEHLLVLAAHHLAVDGAAMAVLLDELATLYRGAATAAGAPALPPAPRFLPRAARDRARAQAQDAGSRLEAWARELAGAAEPLALPGARPTRPGAPRRGAQHLQILPAPIVDALACRAAALGATPFDALLAALTGLLAELTGRERFLVGIAVAGHEPGVVGSSARTLVLPVDESGRPGPAERLARVRDARLGTLGRGDVPLEGLVARLRPARADGEGALLTVMVADHAFPGAPPLDRRRPFGPGVEARPVRAYAGGAKFDLAIYLEPLESGRRVIWQYDRDRLAPATVAAWASRFEARLHPLLDDPQPPRAEPRPATAASPRPGSDPVHGPVPPDAAAPEDPARDPLAGLFATARHEPDRLAYVGPEGHLSYRALCAGADAFAARLTRAGVGPGHRVALALARGRELVEAILGTLRAGASFMVLEPGLPEERRTAMLADGVPGYLVTRDRDLPPGSPPLPPGLRVDRLDQDPPAAAPPPFPGAFPDEAYALFTSGSTGRPRGVALARTGLAAYLRRLGATLGLGPGVRYLHTAPFAFSAAVRQLLLPLTRGATLVLAPGPAVADPVALATLAVRERIGVLDLVPSTWALLAAILPRLDPAVRGDLGSGHLELALSASEPLALDVARALLGALGPRVRLFNMYGLTETTGVVAAHRVRGDEPGPNVPLGRPLPGVELTVLDPAGHPCPVGEAGELAVAGDCLPVGFLGPHPAGPAPLLRTGDLAVLRPDGTFEGLGRCDRQLKIRGRRIEPAGIEAALRSLPGVREAAVDSVRDPDGVLRLVAQVVPDDPARLVDPAWEGALTAGLTPLLAPAEIPGRIVPVPALPRTATGKLRRAAHPPEAPSPPAAARSVERLAEALGRALGRGPLGPDDDFFSRGGDSIRAVEAAARARELGVPFGLAELFRHRTPRLLAGCPAGSREPPLPRPADRRLPAELLSTWAREALTRAGLAPEGAAVVAEVQLEASRREQATHHLGSIPLYARRLAAGLIRGRPRIRVEHRAGALARLDGDDGPGQWVATAAMAEAIALAREHGLGVVAVRRSNHFGAAGHYAWTAAEAGLIGLVTTNGKAVLAPTGGTTPTLGNNPLAVGIPAGSSPPLLLDIAMSVVPRGRIGLALAEGRPLEPGWILDRAGRPTTDPGDLAAGLAVPIGGHKGYGLALVLEVLAGVLSGAGFGLDHAPHPEPRSGTPMDYGHLLLALDPARFMDRAEFAARIDRLIGQLRHGTRADPDAPIRVPGEAELAARAESFRSGVLVRGATLEELARYGREAGLSTRLLP